jgi:hypothetical protein
VYVAARSAMRDQAVACAKLLRANGIEVVSSWHDDVRFEPNLAESYTDHDITIECDRDEKEIRNATHIVRLSDGKPGTGGNLVEWGMARAFGVLRVLVGPEVNIFDRDTAVIHAEAGEDLVAKVRA